MSRASSIYTLTESVCQGPLKEGIRVHEHGSGAPWWSAALGAPGSAFLVQRPARRLRHAKPLPQPLPDLPDQIDRAADDEPDSGPERPLERLPQIRHDFHISS